MKSLLQIKSYLLFSFVILVTIFFGLQLTVVRAQSAGFEAGLAGQMSNVLGTGILANANSANAVAAATRNRGLAKIKSGRATTTFVHSSDIYRYMLDYMTFDETQPTTDAGRMKIVQDEVKRFEAKMLEAGGYKLHDNADASCFASLLSYEAYHDKKMTPAQLVMFRQERQAGRQSYLDYAAYQGSPDQVKEKLYILDAIRAIQAIEWREKARAAKTDAERREADKQAKHYAKYRIN